MLTLFAKGSIRVPQVSPTLSRPLRLLQTKGLPGIHTSLIFNQDNTAANQIRGLTRWIILTDPVACLCVAINYNFGTQLICLSAALVI